MRQRVRTQIVVGLGAALLLAGSTHAQQSVGPSSFLVVEQTADPALNQQVDGNLNQNLDDAAVGLDQAVSLDQMDELRIAQRTGATMRMGIERDLATAILGRYAATGMDFAAAMREGATTEVDMSALRTVDSLLVFGVMAGTVSIACYGIAATWRRKQNLELC
jgi:hypothetical protein